MAWIFLVLGILVAPFPALCIADLRYDREALAYAVMGLSVIVAAMPWALWVILR